MQDNNRDMPIVDKDLYFVIEEKNNQIELTDKGVEYISGKDNPDFFILPEIGLEIAKIENYSIVDDFTVEESKLLASN